MFDTVTITAPHTITLPADHTATVQSVNLQGKIEYNAYARIQMGQE